MTVTPELERTIYFIAGVISLLMIPFLDSWQGRWIEKDVKKEENTENDF